VRGLGPQPNCTTKAPFEEIAAWIDALIVGEWSWARNSRCKYVTLRLDTRSGAYAIVDRNGNDITMGQLGWQYSADNPTPPDAPHAR
jgi:hypothetical protein